MADDRDALRVLLSSSNSAAAHAFDNYLYFPDEQTGKKVAAILRDQGFRVEDRLGADDVNWLVLATCRIMPTDDAVDTMREALEQLAEEHDGEYDGWEAAVESDDQ